MTTDKKTDIAEPTPAWIEDQCQQFEATLTGFTHAMRQRFREKAAQGRGRWLRPEYMPNLYQAMLAHAAAMPLAAGAEADCGNFLAFLWRHNTAHPELAVRPDPGPRMLSGYGLPADLELVRLVLEFIRRESLPEFSKDGGWLASLTPEKVIDDINRRAAE